MQTKSWANANTVEKAAAVAEPNAVTHDTYHTASRHHQLSTLDSDPCNTANRRLLVLVVKEQVVLREPA